MPTRKTDLQIATELGKLRDIKSKVRKHNTFGDNNHDAIDAQCDVLERRMTLDEVHDHYGDESSDEFDLHIFDSALQAHGWMAGTLSDTLADSWAPSARS